MAVVNFSLAWVVFFHCIINYNVGFSINYPMRPQPLFRKIHKWAGLILGIQILLWFTSGFLMSFMPIDEIHGDHLLKKPAPTAINLSKVNLSTIAEQVSAPIQSLELNSWLGQTVVTVKTPEGIKRFTTPDMHPITVINKSQIQQILAAQLKGNPEIHQLKRLNHVPNEARGNIAPLWQVQLADAENTRIYISDQSGQIVAKRTDRWRLFDFLWMLHIMNYDDRVSFNHPLLYITAFSAMLFTLTGFVLLYFRFRKNKQGKKRIQN